MNVAEVRGPLRRFAAFVPFAALVTVIALVALAATVTPAFAQDVVVIASTDDAIAWLQAEEWWGEANRGEQLQVPHAMITGISPAWRERAQNITVAQKKEIFYRFMLPLILHANDMVLDRRARMERMDERLADGGELAPDDLAWLRRLAGLLRIADEDAAAALDGAAPGRLREVLAEALYKLDVIPPGLVLGQAAYESGYGTSRFAAEGNALFGQWTFGGDGLVPSEQRSSLGDHRIAAFEWPFDSVRGYFVNLSAHPAYEELRRLRAERKAAGQPLTSLALADGLIRYSERGQEYVDTLKGIIRVNKLDIADDAVFRDEPVHFLVSAQGEDEAEAVRKEIDDLRRSGELASIVQRMRLD